MTSSSSLYGSVTTQNASSTNSTSLYGGADTPIPDSSGNVVVRGDLIVLSGNILTTAETGNIFPANATTINLGLAATALNIGAGTGLTTINNNLEVAGDLTINGAFVAPDAQFGNITIAVATDNTITTTTGGLVLQSATKEIDTNDTNLISTNSTSFNLLNSPTTVNAFNGATALALGAATGTTTIRNDATVSGDLRINGNDIKSSANTTAITLSGNDVILADDLTITGNNVNLAQTTIFGYDENGDRLNRPTFKSTTGNTSGLRVSAPNATTSASAALSAFNSNDDANGKFIQFLALGSATNPVRIRTGKYTAGVFGASGDKIAFYDGNTAYAFANPAGTVDAQDLATKSYVDAQELNTTYTIDASSTTGGANLNLVGSDSTTDSIKFTGTGSTTVTRTDANTITIDTITADPTKLVNGLYEFTLNADGSVTTPSKISAAGPLTLQGGALDPTTVVVDDTSLVATFDQTLPGGDSAVLTATNGSMSWAHTAGVMSIGSEDGTWSLNADGTTSFPNYNFPYADGSANQVLKTNGSGVLAWYSPSDLNTTYTIDASSTTGGANFNLVGSDASTDTIKIASGTGITVAQTDANTITVNSTITQYTDALARGSISAGTGIAYNSTTGVIDSTITQYTDAMARSSISAGTGIAYNSTTGVIDSTITQYTDAMARSSISATGDISYNSTTGVISYTTPTAPVTSVNSQTGAVVLDTDDISEGSTNLYYTDARARASLSAGTNISYNSTTGVISSTDTNTTYTQDVSSTTGGANLNLVGSDATTDSVKFAGGTNVTVVATDASTMTINAVDTNTTYDFAATSTTGGANLNLTGSDSTTDTVKISSGTGVSVSQISGTEISVAIGQAVDTGATPSFAGLSAGNLTVGVATDNTIASTDTNGDIILDPNGSGEIMLASVTRVLGEVQSTTEPTYVFPPQTLNTVTDNNGYSAASSFPAGTNGYGANATFTHYYGDTLAGTNTAPAFNFRNANGNSVTGMTVPFTGVTSTAATATQSGNVMGTLNFNGYGTTGFSNDIASSNQGGGNNALQSMQVQGYPTEAFSDSTLTLTSTNVTAVASSFRAALVTPSVTGTKGQISFGSTTTAVGQAIRVTGTLTGTATGIVSGQDYYIVVTNASTTATLSLTPGGSPITTTAGTLTGLTLTRCSVTFTTTGLTSVPYGRGAKVAVSGVTNVTNGTYPVWGTPTTTSFSIGIPHSVAPTVGGSQSFSCLTTYMGSGFRIRAFPTATPGNLQNRLEIIDHTPAAATYRSNSFTFNTGAYGNTGVGVTSNNIIYNRVYGQFQYNTTVTPVAINTAYVFPLGTADVNNIATVGSTSRLIPGAAGQYNLQFSVQVNNADNGTEHTAYIWLRKNGVDVAGSMGRKTVFKGGATIVSWNYILTPTLSTDYYELAYAVDDLNLTFPNYAATAFGPSTATIITSLTPVGA